MVVGEDVVEVTGNLRDRLEGDEKEIGLVGGL